MISGGWAEFWWSNITGPQAVVSQVADLLLEKRMVVLTVPADLPWRHDMRSIIETNLRMKSSFPTMIIETIDAEDDCPPEADLGRFLLQRFAPRRVQNAYREGSGMTIQEYIIQNGVLKNTIVWVKGVDPNQAKRWLGFCGQYLTKGIGEGLFVVEIPGSISVPDSEHMRTVDFWDYVSSYDLQLFNSFVLDGVGGYNDHWKRYIAAVAARLCDVDAEVSEAFMRETGFMRQEPLEGMGQIVHMPEFQKRGRDQEGDHVLFHYRNENWGVLEKQVWIAQVQILFPVIEMERLQIISTWYTYLEDALQANEITQYGTRIEDPLDLELGTLVYYMSWRDGLGNYYIYIPSAETRDRVRFLHECRNILAHLRLCSVEQVKEILG